jgi:hypothetical protein
MYGGTKWSVVWASEKQAEGKEVKLGLQMNEALRYEWLWPLLIAW